MFGFLVFSFLLLANAVVLRNALAVQINSARWVDHTSQVILELQQVQALLVDAETAQRGFLYTGDAKYLQPFSAANQVDAHLQNLERLVSDNPDQSRLLTDLGNLSHQKIQELSETISLYRSKKYDNAKALVLSDRGEELMDRIRSAVAEMSDRENALLAERSSDSGASRKTMRRSIYAVTLVALIGLAILCLWVLSDIKRRDQHAAEIRKREEWLRVILTSIGDAVIATDAKARILFMNPKAEALTGFGGREASGRQVTEVFPIFDEQTLQPVENPIIKGLELGIVTALTNHTILKRRDGSTVPIEDSAAPIRDDRNRLIGMVLVFRDATHGRESARAQKESAEALRASEEQLRLAANAGDLGLWTWKVGSQELMATEQCKALFGLRADATFDYATAIAIVHPEDRAKTEASIQQAIERRAAYRAEYRVVWRDGSIHWISAVGRCSYDENGAPTVLSGACIDNTERRQAEEVVRLSHSLSSVSRVAHELAHHINNPLTIITQSLYLLENSKNGFDPALLTAAQDATERISKIARQLLGLYSPYAKPSLVRLTDFLDDALDAYSSGLPPGSIEIMREYDSGGELFASATDIRQLCANLVANAFEHSKLGSKISVRVSQRRHPVSGETGLRMLVADTGSGIPAAHRDRLFEAFFSTKETKSSGLGLWTARSIVNKYGGAIRWRSSTQDGRSGAAFQVFIPVNAKSEAQGEKYLGITA